MLSELVAEQPPLTIMAPTFTGIWLVGAIEYALSSRHSRRRAAGPVGTRRSPVRLRMPASRPQATSLNGQAFACRGWIKCWLFGYVRRLASACSTTLCIRASTEVLTQRAGSARGEEPQRRCGELQSSAARPTIIAAGWSRCQGGL